jgi:hypothetical protein
MISPRLARRIAGLHKWLGLVVGVQLVVWTLTGLFFTVFSITHVRGEHLVHPPSADIVDVSRVKLSTIDALRAVAEDKPQRVILRSLAGEPVYEVRADIGVFLVSAETGQILSPVSEEVARAVASEAWAGEDEPVSVEMIEDAPIESGVQGAVWAARFAGEGRPVVYVNAATGERAAVRTDLWRAYDFLWSLHIMDYRERSNFNHPLIIAAATLALTTVLFGVALLLHRFTRRSPAG